MNMDKVYQIVSMLSLVASIIWFVNGDAYIGTQYCITAFLAQILAKMEE